MRPYDKEVFLDLGWFLLLLVIIVILCLGATVMVLDIFRWMKL